MNIFYKIYQLLIAAPLLLISTLLCAIVTIIGCSLGSSKFWGYYPGKIWSIIFCSLLLLPVEVKGREKLDKKASYVFVANHQGAMDIFLIYGFLQRNFKWMMKKSLKQIPLVGFACEKAGFIFVDRGSTHGIKETLESARKSLQDGVSLMVFPEGSRTYDGKMRSFSKGAFFLADELQLPVVPITINGSYDVLPRTHDISFVHRRKMSLTIHDIIPPQGKGSENMHALSRLSYDAINSALPQCYKN